ncbi:MAG: YjjG family noncanonical pyrimidine nucleotidase [Lactobacillus crispatus]|uniref:YjjG family noncanonical pyrimidine nucleotidase n=1 Tax=Lactobacillus crispatus TaxID=47770 RepID=UPI00254E23DA|nr:YjjG family noncanonical pyrimidine nucleotidase [Lactobacillus crispatus]MDK6377039.1 YjjG family noncanonical pyrimidine nucleotidase [Lactobacillus crispatus]MDK8509494.1 YjjG family noncanonical pyrimidine nucleotidase [Lactobacillus crispatus]
MRYQQIIFDVDDTIIDFAATEDFALHSLFNAHHWPLSAELQRQYHSYNQGLWRRLEQGELTYEELSEMTFHDFILDHFGIEIDGKKAMDEYRSYFGEAHQLLPGVEDTLIFAKKQGYKLTVLSNGEKFMQNHRLELAGVKKYFDLIVTSEEAHYSKPNPHAFDYFFSRTEIGSSETVFFGDGLQSDILGAEKYGFDSIWYNHRHRKNTLNLHPKFVVETYPELVKLMQNDFEKKY